jgi:predicted component of type VI protein secretion system
VPRSAPRGSVPPGNNVIAFPGVERELVLEVAAALARYGASAATLQRLRRARRPDAALMRHAYHELRRLGGHHWLLAVVRAWHDGLSDFEALRTLKEMNADRFDFN